MNQDVALNYFLSLECGLYLGPASKEWSMEKGEIKLTIAAKSGKCYAGQMKKANMPNNGSSNG